MASFFQRGEQKQEQEQRDIERFVSEGGHDRAAARDMAQREATWLRTGRNTAPKATFSVNIDEDTLEVIRKDAEFQGLSPQDLVRWLLEKYAAGELTAKHFPDI